MADQLKPAQAFVFSRSPIVDKDGNPTYPFLKQLLVWQQQLSNGLNSIGQVTQSIPQSTQIQGRVAIGTLLQYIDDNGMVLADGIDFARAYINKDTDHIADGSGLPLNGGKAAQVALVDLPPIPEASKWVNGLFGGVFTKTQPTFTDISGTASPAQVPPLSSLSGQITTGQLPASGLTVTIVTAQLTTLGTPGSMDFTNGILTAQVPAT